ncbi:hypothetical protein ACG2LH_12580 [Zhouia sp. PK063]|uniref:hypothetical protein n=1 Tax=Zhouia sp. PK063 TaxID=3373602 RepID=UPI0037998070
MKRILLSLLISLMLFSCEKEKKSTSFSKGSNVEKNNNKSLKTERKEILFLKEFYLTYISFLKKNPLADRKDIDKIIQKFCTKELMIKIRDLDYDPFLNAQDFDDDILDKLKIFPSDASNKFIVTYIDSFSSNQIKIEISLTVNKNYFKISDLK